MLIVVFHDYTLMIVIISRIKMKVEKIDKEGRNR